MIRLLDVQMVSEIVQKHGIDSFLVDLMECLRIDFSHWENFDQIPRPAFHVSDGVIELMPIANKEMFTYKCVNGHPKNPGLGKQTIVATGQLLENKTGHPLLISEMTLLTALRTAAVSAIASNLLSRKESKTLAIIGTGAQSEFQLLAHKQIRDIKVVNYFDTDIKAMDKFLLNMRKNPHTKELKFVACKNIAQALEDADIIIVCTACKKHVNVIEEKWVKKGQHISALGGDCPGKTELELSLLENSKVVVEYFEQSFLEGEIQRFSKEKALEVVYAHLHEIILKQKKGRISDSEITIFDSVGISLADFTTLNFIYFLSEKYHIGSDVGLIPNISDPKDLFSIL